MPRAMDGDAAAYDSIEPSQVAERSQWPAAAVRRLWVAVLGLAIEDAATPHGWLKGGQGCPRCSAWEWIESGVFAGVAEMVLVTRGEDNMAVALDVEAVRAALRRRLGGPGVHPRQAGQALRSQRDPAASMRPPHAPVGGKATTRDAGQGQGQVQASGRGGE